MTCWVKGLPRTCSRQLSSLSCSGRKQIWVSNRLYSGQELDLSRKWGCLVPSRPWLWTPTDRALSLTPSYVLPAAMQWPSSSKAGNKSQRCIVVKNEVMSHFSASPFHPMMRQQHRVIVRGVIQFRGKIFLLTAKAGLVQRKDEGSFTFFILLNFCQKYTYIRNPVHLLIYLTCLISVFHSAWTRSLSI